MKHFAYRKITTGARGFVRDWGTVWFHELRRRDRKARHIVRNSWLNMNIQLIDYAQWLKLPSSSTHSSDLSVHQKSDATPITYNLESPTTSLGAW